jgi:hypothetical protein
VAIELRRKLTLLFALLLVTAVVFVVFEYQYGSPVSRRGLSDLQITTNPSRNPTTVSIDGGLISSSLAVSGIKQRQNGRCIVVIVREAPVRHGRVAGRFHLDVDVLDNINEIAFGDSHEVIWHR